MKAKTAKLKTAGTAGNTVLGKLRKQFPTVQQVIDATESITINVTKRDAAIATKKDNGNCALAKAVCRQESLDGAIIGLTKSYLIKGKTATRYSTPITVSREITSFDRHADFREGADYRLSKVAAADRLGARPTERTRPEPTGKKHVELQCTHRHTTADIRKKM